MEKVKILEKPYWLNKKINLEKVSALSGFLKELNLNTVCQQAACPNIGECFSRGEATFMILGRVCTRNCRFCNIEKGKPDSIDAQEPYRIAQAVEKLNLKHVVITSVTRDDLRDGGVDIFCETVRAIKNKKPEAKIEVLIPDFKGRRGAVEEIISAGPDIIAHNVETVPRLYPQIRPQADYRRSLKILDAIKKINSHIYTKSGLMLGLGEKEEEIINVFQELRGVNCDFLSLGQYLRPSKRHYPVKEYIEPWKFDYYRRCALKYGFLYVLSAPYVRSSYQASSYLTYSK